MCPRGSPRLTLLTSRCSDRPYSPAKVEFKLLRMRPTCSIVHIECVACPGPVFLLRSVCRSPAIHHVRTAPVSASRAIVCGLYEGSPIGSVKRKIAPRGWFAAADSRPP